MVKVGLVEVSAQGRCSVPQGDACGIEGLCDCAEALILLSQLVEPGRESLGCVRKGLVTLLDGSKAGLGRLEQLSPVGEASLLLGEGLPLSLLQPQGPDLIDSPLQLLTGGQEPDGLLAGLFKGAFGLLK